MNQLKSSWSSDFLFRLENYPDFLLRLIARKLDFKIWAEIAYRGRNLILLQASFDFTT